jgi:ferredoxin
MITIPQRLRRSDAGALIDWAGVLIDPHKCVACGNCVPVCPMGAIYLEDGLDHVNQDQCVECSTCYRFLPSEGLNPILVRLTRRVIQALRLRFDQPLDRCPTGALDPPELEWPRSLRRAFSDPLVVHDDTGLAGRGTEEIKTNDITGRIGEGEAGMVIDLGRPGIGVQFSDIQKLTVALAALETEFEAQNPVTLLMEDQATGRLNPEVLEQNVLSAIIEFKTTLDRLPTYLRIIDELAGDLDTVISVGVASRCGPDGEIPHQAICQQAGRVLSPNGKTNLGLGRPIGASAGGGR